MPKKYSVVQMRDWLRRYEQGEPEASIAASARCDVRTLKKGLEAARRERDAGVARSELIKDSLKKHQETLLGEIDGLLGRMSVPEPDLVVQNSRYGDPEPVALPMGRALWRGGKEFEIKVYLEDTVLWGLLHEHLKRDKIWEYLQEWEKAVALHLKARYDLRMGFISHLESTTRTRVVKEDGETSSKGHIFETGVDSICRIIFKWATGANGKAALKESIDSRIERIETTANGHVQDRSGNPVYAFAPGREQKRKRQIVRALTEIQDSPTLDAVRETCRVLEEACAKARRQREEVSLLGLVPGQCRICRRLGM